MRGRSLHLLLSMCLGAAIFSSCTTTSSRLGRPCTGMHHDVKIYVKHDTVSMDANQHFLMVDNVDCVRWHLVDQGQNEVEYFIDRINYVWNQEKVVPPKLWRNFDNLPDECAQQPRVKDCGFVSVPFKDDLYTYEVIVSDANGNHQLKLDPEMSVSCAGGCKDLRDAFERLTQELRDCTNDECVQSKVDEFKAIVGHVFTR